MSSNSQTPKKSTPSALASTLKRTADDVYRGFIHTTQNGMALLGLLLAVVLVVFGARADLRASAEERLLSWLLERQESSQTVERLVDVEPTAIERVTAADIGDLTEQQAKVTQWLSRKYRVAPEPLAALVAHDWGGAVAWNLANQQPQLLERLVIINSPHPGTFLRELQHSPEQQAASAYMNFLIRPDAEALLAANDYERLWKLFSNMGATTGRYAWLTEAARDRYRNVWNHGLTGGCNYYRASPLRPPVRKTRPPRLCSCHTACSRWTCPRWCCGAWATSRCRPR